MSKYRDLDLNELKTELRNAYVRKTLEAQIREKEADREMEKVRENYSANLTKLTNLELEDQARKRAIELDRKREIYRCELELQMSEKERVKKVQEEEAKRERKLLEESDRIVDEEILAEKLRTRRELAERQQREKIILEEIRATRKRVEAEEKEEETRRNEKYLEEIQQRRQELETLRQAQQRRRDDLINTVAQMLVNCRSKKLEEEARIAELVAAEMSWELVIQEREDELRRRRAREKLAEDLRDQMIFREECARRSVERDRIFAEMVMRRAMEDERIEKLTNEAKMRSRMQYRRDLIRLMEERGRIRRLERERIKLELEREREIEKTRVDGILEARRELLAEHARNVASYVNDNLLTESEKIIVTDALKK